MSEKGPTTKPVLVVLIFGILVGCAAPGASPSIQGTPLPVPSAGEHLATAPVPPPSLSGDSEVPPADAALPPPPSLDPNASPRPEPSADGAAGFSNVHGGWPQHGPGGAGCLDAHLQVMSSMSRWPGYQDQYILGGATIRYTAQFLWYQGWLGWRDSSGAMRYQAGPAIGAFGELNSATTRSWVWINNGWVQTDPGPSTGSGYFGNDSKVPLPFKGSYWVWINHYWGPISEGTIDRPGRQVFAGASHLDYLNVYSC